MTSVHLEIINVCWAVISWWLVIVMANYVLINVYQGQWSRPSVMLAKGLAILFLGEGAIRAWIWWARAAQRDGADVGWMFTSHWLVVFALIAIVGAVCVSRVVSPSRWGHGRWLIPSGLAAAATAWSVLGVQG
jgi:hypothetical protein